MATKGDAQTVAGATRLLGGPMASLGGRIGATTLALLLVSFDVRANCIEDPRTVQLDTDTVRIKSYSCGSTPGDSPLVKVEFHRLSSTVASLVAQRQSSTMLDRTLGTFRVAKNDVLATYTALLRQFGTTFNLTGYAKITLHVETAGRGGNATPGDSINSDSVTVLSSGERANYPALDEIVNLRGAVIPSNIRFYYSGSFESRVTRYYWRGLSNEDLNKYFASLGSYNSMMGYPAPSSTFMPASLRMARHMAGSEWPSDFVLLIGRYLTPEDTLKMCGTDPGWDFEYWTRRVIMEVMLVENISDKPIHVDGMIGRRAPESRLHVLNTSPGPARDLRPVGQLSENLRPGEKVLVPTKIISPAQPLSAREWENSNEIYRRIGANQFTGNTAGHAVPLLKNYAYGPELIVTGVTVDGKRIDFSQRSANFFDMTISSEEGSCPYLLSWDSSQERWLEHGKALHRAEGSVREETETWTFPGFVPRFRFEEREPEVAYIDFAGLTVALKDGSTIELVSSDQFLSTRDGNYLSLAWGDAMEFSFELPDGIAASDVLQSRLSLTGYYDRYPRPSKQALQSQVSLRANATRLDKFGLFCSTPIRPIAVSHERP